MGKLSSDQTIQGFFGGVAEDSFPIMEAFYPQGREPLIHIEDIEHGEFLIRCGLFTIIMLLIYSTTARSLPIMEGIMFLLVYLLGIYLPLAAWTGGIQKYTVKGFGKTARFLEEITLDWPDMEKVEGYCKAHHLPSYEIFLRHSTLQEATKKKLYSHLEEDFKTVGHHPLFERHDDIFSQFNANARYMGLFFAMPLIYLVMWAIDGLHIFKPGTGSVLMLLLFVLAEEVLKGVGYFMVKTEREPFHLGSLRLSPEITKGMVAGCGYAFIESFMRLQDGRNPLVNLIATLPATALHMVASGMFFVGLAALSEELSRASTGPNHSIIWKDVDTSHVKAGALIMSGAVVLHFVFNLLVWWLL